jgi:hypothetical protein
MEKKQTAVEWFWNNLTDDMIGDLSPEQIGSIYKLMEQAKQMEKEQIIKAANHGCKGMCMIDTSRDGKEYYNETYGGQDDN